MATTQFAFGPIGYNHGGGVIPHLLAAGIVSQSLTPSGSPGATTAVAQTLGGNPRIACRVATDTAVYVSFGTAPNASNDASRILVPANTVETVFVNAGDKGSVVTIA